MITMMDEIFDRGYQSGRAELHNGIDGLIGRIKNAVLPGLSAQYRFEWNAPWQSDAKLKP
jgi:hypothetical protein